MNCLKNSRTIVIITILLLTTCLPLSAQKIETIDGAKYVHNEGEGKWQDNESVHIEYLGTLGEIEDADENYNFYLPNGIAADKDGNLYVLDAGNHRVQVFDKDHNFIRTFGNHGQGPGEFMLPTHIEIDLEGNVTVFDNGNSRFEKFTSGGDYISSIRNTETTYSFRYLSTGEIILRNPGLEGYRSFKKAVPKFYILDDKLNKIRTIGETEFFGEDTHQKYSGLNRLRFAVDDKDYIYTALRFQNIIEKYDYDGNLKLVIDRPVSQHLQSRKLKKPFSKFSTNGISVDNKGWIWTLTQRKGFNKGDIAGLGMKSDSDGNSSYWIWGNPEVKKNDCYMLELFSPEGILLKRFILEHYITKMWILNNRIYILEQIRGMQFHVYDIQIPEGLIYVQRRTK